MTIVPSTGRGALVDRHLGSLSDATLISGGNDETDGNVQLVRRRDGWSVDGHLTEIHPEIGMATEEEPRGDGCQVMAAERPQLLVTNLMVASAMLSCLWQINERIRVDESTVERIVRVLSRPETRPVDVNRARLERMKRELALDHAAGRIDDKTYLAQIAVLREEATRIDSGQRPTMGIAPDKVVAKLQALPKTWAQAIPAGRAELLHSIDERIVVRGPEFVGARLTPEAYSLGLALELPEAVMAHPSLAEERVGLWRPHVRKQCRGRN